MATTYTPEPKDLQALRYRCIGPHRGGRASAVAGHPTERATFYFGACAGGVWKSDDAGTYWENISDGYFTSAAIGALTVSEADPNVIYAGTGETNIRLDVSYGDGVYRTTDGGRSWSHLGLAETRHIGEIRVHPRDPDVAYVAALGHLFGPNEQRGVFRTVDGGKSWEQVLYVSDKAGAVDLTMDPHNPRILYAAIWECYRNFWTLSSGGEDSGIYRSTDGGDTWQELTEGLPQGIKGKIGITASPQPDRVWAVIEAEEGGVYRSDDGGDKWELMSNHKALFARPFYYCHIFADPGDGDTVYITNLKMYRSTDGGRAYDEMTTPHGDNHDLWIDPADPQRMIEGNDGGACVSYNGGASWSTIFNQPTAQFYRIATDNRFPYNVYATQQDNSSLAVPSATEYNGIPWTHCYPVGTGESGDVTVHPEDDDIAYVGAIGSSPGGNGVLQRYDHRTKQVRLVNVWPEENFGWAPRDMKYRFSWTFPISFSPHDAGILYAAGNIVFRSTNEGESWEPISPDLTRNDPDKLGPSGGPITRDNTGAEGYGTVYAFAESAHEAGTFWAGSDDGLIHISRDGGGSWSEITPAGLEPFTHINNIELSAHAAGTAWVAASRFKLDDYQPYLFRTRDYGQSWDAIAAGMPDGEVTRVIREDPQQAGLLYVGTDSGMFVSLDSGANWLALRNNLPVVPVYDLLVKGDDLVIGTHGRSFWILDEVTPLRVLAARSGAPGTALLTPVPTVRRNMNWGVGFFRGPGKNYMLGLGGHAAFYHEEELGESRMRLLDAGENPPPGVIIYYYLEEQPEEPITLEILAADGKLIRSFASKTENEVTHEEEEETEEPVEHQYLSATAGLNRFVWDMRYPDAPKLLPNKAVAKAVAGPRTPAPKVPNGPLAAPGRCQIRLTVGDRVSVESFELRSDPRIAATSADLDVQFQLRRQIHERLSEGNRAVNRLRRVRDQLTEWKKKAAAGGDAAAAVADAAAALLEKLAAIEAALAGEGDDILGDRIRFPAAVIFKLSGLAATVALADAAPTAQMRAVYENLAAQVEAETGKLRALIDTDLQALNRLIGQSGLQPIAV